VNVTDLGARAGIVSAGSTIAVASMITGVGSRRHGLVSTQPMILGFVVPTTEISTKLPVGEDVVAWGPGVRTSENRTVMQARKESLWRQLLGVTYALTVVFTPGEGQLSIGLGGHEWVDAAVSGAIGLVVVPPVLLGTAYGIWKENKLDQEVWQVIDKAVSATEL